MALNLMMLGAIIVTILFYVFDIVSSVLWTPLLVFGFFAAIVLLWCIVGTFFTAFISMKKEYNTHSPFYRHFVNVIVESMGQFMRMKIHVTGKEILPDEKFLLVCNHKSFMDPLVTMGVLKKYNMSFVAKKQIFKVPVIRKLMHRCFCLCLDRRNLKEEAKTIFKAADIVKEQKASMGIYPEGTRNKGEGLLPFMAGSFKIAKRANCPIVVATIKNTNLAAKNMPFKKTDVYLDFLQVLDKDFVKAHSTTELSDAARKIIEGNI